MGAVAAAEVGLAAVREVEVRVLGGAAGLRAPFVLEALPAIARDVPVVIIVLGEVVSAFTRACPVVADFAVLPVVGEVKLERPIDIRVDRRAEVVSPLVVVGPVVVSLTRLVAAGRDARGSQGRGWGRGRGRAGGEVAAGGGEGGGGGGEVWPLVLGRPPAASSTS